MSGAEQTLEHIVQVQSWISRVVVALRRRSLDHDISKLNPPEIAGFDRLAAENPLKDVVYGSPEYFEALARFPDAIMHHWAHNDHHPEFWALENGILDPEWVKNGTAIARMSLVSLTEMLCD